MTRKIQFALALSLLAILTGCGSRGPVGRDDADALAAWIDAQTFSSFETFSHAGRQPEHPPSPDGLTLGSPNVFAAIGTEPDDLSSLDVFWGGSRTTRPFARPMTVAVGVRGKGVPKGDASDAVPLATFPDQTLAEGQVVGLAQWRDINIQEVRAL